MGIILDERKAAAKQNIEEFNGLQGGNKAYLIQIDIIDDVDERVIQILVGFLLLVSRSNQTNLLQFEIRIIFNASLHVSFVEFGVW